MQARGLAVKKPGLFKSRIPILDSRKYSAKPEEDLIHMFGKLLKVKDPYQPTSKLINLGELLNQERQNCENYRHQTKGLKKVRPEVLVLSLEGRLTFAAALMQALSLLHAGGEMFISMEAEYINFDGFLSMVSFDIPDGINWEDKVGLIGDACKEGEDEYLLHPALDIQEMVPLLACLLLGSHDYDPNRPHDPTRLATYFSQAWPSPVWNKINNLMADMIKIGGTSLEVKSLFEEKNSQAADNLYSRLLEIKTTYQHLSTLKQDTYFIDTARQVEEPSKMRSCRP